MRLRIIDSKAVIPHPGAGAASREPAAAVSAGTLDPLLLCAFLSPNPFPLQCLEVASPPGLGGTADGESKGWEMGCSASEPGCSCRDLVVFVGGRAGAAE